MKFRDEEERRQWAAFVAGWKAAVRNERNLDPDAELSLDSEDGVEIAMAFDEWQKESPR